MIYPNGSIDMNQLKSMVDSEDYEVFFEEKSEEPKDWNWKEQGFWHGERISIKTLDDLRKYLSEEIMNAGTICYDITDNYTKKHPCLGEEHIYIRRKFSFGNGSLMKRTNAIK